MDTDGALADREGHFATRDPSLSDIHRHHEIRKPDVERRLLVANERAIAHLHFIRPRREEMPRDRLSPSLRLSPVGCEGLDDQLGMSPYVNLFTGAIFCLPSARRGD